MAARKLGTSPVSLQKYDVVGTDAQSAPEFVRHIGMADPAVDKVVRGDQVSVAHMGPPLESDGEMPVHAVGSAKISAEEVNQIKLFVDQHTSEHLAHKLAGIPGSYAAYIIRPHARPEHAKDGTTKYVRFNCAGFVIEAYRDAGIDVLLTDESRLPVVDLETLQHAYPELASPLGQRLNHRYKWGCEGKGPWPVVLPGYLLHAFHRVANGNRAAIYVPQPGDERFNPV